MRSRASAHRRIRFGGPRVRAAVVGAAMVGGLMAVNSGTSYAVEFCNTAPINGTSTFGPLGVYPSPIVVSGLTGTVTDVNVSLLGLTTARPTRTASTGSRTSTSWSPAPEPARTP